jgi:hypothetical protein
MNSSKAVRALGADENGGEEESEVGEEGSGDVELVWSPETEESWKTSQRPHSS